MTMRKLALLFGIFAAFTLVTPIANFVETLHRISAPSIGLTLVKIGATVFVSVVAGVGWLFFFALYRDRGMLHVSRRLRFLGGGAALLLGIILAANLPRRISELINDWAEVRKLDWWGGAASSWDALQDPYSMASIANVVNVIQIALSIALLIALSRNPTDEPSKKIPVGRLLRVVSEMTAKATGLVLIFRLIGLLLVPYSYSLVRHYVYESDAHRPQSRIC